MVKLGEASPSVLDDVIEKLEKNFKNAEETILDFQDYTTINKLDREVYQQFGSWKDIILDPRFQSMKQWYLDNISWDLVVGNPRVPIPYAVVILFLMYSKLPKPVVLLSGAFMFNLNPIYVVSSACLYWMLSGSKKPLGFNKSSKRAQVELLENCCPLKLESSNLEESCDYVIIGNSFSALFTAALLSRCGWKVFVFQPEGQDVEVNIPNCPCKLPLESMLLTKIETYEHLFDPIQPTKAEERVKFERVGNLVDGYTHTIVQVNPVDMNEEGRMTAAFAAQKNDLIASITQHCSGDSSKMKEMVEVLSQAQKNLSLMLFTKAYPMGKDFQIDSLAKSSSGFKQISDLCSNTTMDVLERSISDKKLRSLFVALSVLGQSEGSVPYSSPSVGLASFLQASESGFYCPQGGWEELMKCCIRAIRAMGGNVFSNVCIDEILIENQGSPSSLHCRGVRVHSSDLSWTCMASKGVVSSLGLLQTFTRLLPNKYVSLGIRNRISSLIEKHPVVKTYFWINKSHEELNLTSCQYVKVSPYEEKSWQPEELKDNDKEFEQEYCHIVCPFAADNHWKEKHPNLSLILVETNAPSNLVRLKPYHFTEKYCNESEAEADKDDSVQESKQARLYSSSYSRPITSLTDQIVVEKGSHNEHVIVKRCWKMVLSIYPNLSNIPESERPYHVHWPRLGGQALSSTPSRYGCQMTCHTDIQGFYMGCSDLTSPGFAGEWQAGWITANALLGYKVNDLIMGRNVTGDLKSVPKPY